MASGATGAPGDAGTNTDVEWVSDMIRRLVESQKDKGGSVGSAGDPQGGTVMEDPNFQALINISKKESKGQQEKRNRKKRSNHVAVG